MHDLTGDNRVSRRMFATTALSLVVGPAVSRSRAARATAAVDADRSVDLAKAVDEWARNGHGPAAIRRALAPIFTGPDGFTQSLLPLLVGTDLHDERAYLKFACSLQQLGIDRTLFPIFGTKSGQVEEGYRDVLQGSRRTMHLWAAFRMYALSHPNDFAREAGPNAPTPESVSSEVERDAQLQPLSFTAAVASASLRLTFYDAGRQKEGPAELLALLGGQPHQPFHWFAEMVPLAIGEGPQDTDAYLLFATHLRLAALNLVGRKAGESIAILGPGSEETIALWRQFRSMFTDANGTLDQQAIDAYFLTRDTRFTFRRNSLLPGSEPAEAEWDQRVQAQKDLLTSLFKSGKYQARYDSARKMLAVFPEPGDRRYYDRLKVPVPPAWLDISKNATLPLSAEGVGRLDLRPLREVHVPSAQNLRLTWTNFLARQQPGAPTMQAQQAQQNVAVGHVPNPLAPGLTYIPQTQMNSMQNGGFTPGRNFSYFGGYFQVPMYLDQYSNEWERRSR